MNVGKAIGSQEQLQPTIFQCHCKGVIGDSSNIFDASDKIIVLDVATNVMLSRGVFTDHDGAYRAVICQHCGIAVGKSSVAVDHPWRGKFVFNQEDIINSHTGELVSESGRLAFVESYLRMSLRIIVSLAARLEVLETAQGITSGEHIPQGLSKSAPTGSSSSALPRSAQSTSSINAAGFGLSSQATHFTSSAPLSLSSLAPRSFVVNPSSLANGDDFARGSTSGATSSSSLRFRDSVPSAASLSSPLAPRSSFLPTALSVSASASLLSPLAPRSSIVDFSSSPLSPRSTVAGMSFVPRVQPVNNNRPTLNRNSAGHADGEDEAVEIRGNEAFSASTSPTAGSSGSVGMDRGPRGNSVRVPDDQSPSARPTSSASNKRR